MRFSLRARSGTRPLVRMTEGSLGVYPYPRGLAGFEKVRFPQGMPSCGRAYPPPLPAPAPHPPAPRFTLCSPSRGASPYCPADHQAHGRLVWGNNELLWLRGHCGDGIDSAAGEAQ